MTFTRALSVFALAIFAAGGVAQAQERKKPTCQSIMNICMKRAGSGHAGICEDMFAQAKEAYAHLASAAHFGKVAISID